MPKYKDKTINDAINKGLAELKKDRHDVAITVIQKPSSILLGMFKRKAIVEIIVNNDKNVEAKILPENQIIKPEYRDALINYLKQVMNVLLLEVKFEADLHADDELDITIISNDGNEGILIGHHGRTLTSLQMISKAFLQNKYGLRNIKVQLDVNDYRKNRRIVLRDLALKSADRCKQINHRIKLDPMPVFERKVIHQVLYNDPEVSTIAVGTEPYRSVVIIPEQEIN